ncbi:hypothetical protein ACLOJK_026409 [Asimina triloba]
MEGFLMGPGKRVALDHGIEEEEIWVLGLDEEKACVRHFAERGANTDEVGDEEIGLVEVSAEEMGVDFSEVGAGGAAMEEAKDVALCFPPAAAATAHQIDISTDR